MLDDQGACIEGHSGLLGRATNNVAEYHALLEALELAQARRADEVLIQADAELIVRQIEGAYRVRHPDLKPLHARALGLIRGFPRFRIRHVPRAQNKEADRLVNHALDSAETPTETPAPPLP